MQTQNPEQDFYEIYDYYTQPLLERKSVQVSLISIGIITITSLIFIFIFLRKKLKPLTVWQVALKELNQLNPDKYTTKEDFKNFYFKLTDIFKRYLNKRYNWPTQDKTDSELIKQLEQQNFNQNFNSDILAQVQKILEGALWVKFANQDALKVQAQADLQTIIKIIDLTKPVEHK